MNRFSKTVYLTILVFAMVFALVGCKTTTVAPGEELTPAPAAPEAPATPEAPAAPAEEAPAAPAEEAPAAPAEEAPAAPVEEPAPVVEEPVVEVAEVAEPALQPVELKYVLFGSDITVLADVGHATVTYPAFITNADIDALAQAAVAQFGAAVADVRYAAKGGVLDIYYPETWTVADLQVAEQAVMAYVAAVTAPKPYVITLDVAGFEATVECYEGYADVTYPAFITTQEIVDAAAAAYAAYSQYLSGVIFDVVEPGKAVLTYGEGLTAADFEFAGDILQKEITAYVASFMPEASEPAIETVYEAPAVYTAEINLFGYTATLTYTEKNVVVEYPAFITSAEIKAAAQAAFAAYGKYLQGTVLAIDNGMAVLSFPVAITEADFNAAVGLLNAELPAYVASLFPAEEPVVEAVVAEVVEAPAAEPVVEAPAAEPVVEAPAAEPVVEAPAAEPVVEAPAAAPETPAPAAEQPAPAPAASTTTTPAPAPAATTTAPAPEAKKSNTGLIVVIIILVVAAAAAAFIVLKKKKN